MGRDYFDRKGGRALFAAYCYYDLLNHDSDCVLEIRELFERLDGLLGPGEDGGWEGLDPMSFSGPSDDPWDRWRAAATVEVRAAVEHRRDLVAKHFEARRFTRDFVCRWHLPLGEPESEFRHPASQVFAALRLWRLPAGIARPEEELEPIASLLMPSFGAIIPAPPPALDPDVETTIRWDAVKESWEDLFGRSGRKGKVGAVLDRLKEAYRTQARDLQRETREAGWPVSYSWRRDVVQRAVRNFFLHHRPIAPVSIADLARQRLECSDRSGESDLNGGCLHVEPCEPESAIGRSASSSQLAIESSRKIVSTDISEARSLLAPLGI